MKNRPVPAPAIVVGIDGSRAALDAALWAVDEAVSRDIPLRLLYAIEPRERPDSDQAARDLATAEMAVRAAFMAVESLEQPVKIEVEIVQDRAVHALMTASRSATMLCVGGLGIGRSTGRHYGSVAAAVSRSGNCPVAIIHHHDSAPVGDGGWVVAEVDDSPDSPAVLDHSVREARLRNCALRILTGQHPRTTDGYEAQHPRVAHRMARANLDRQLAWWRRRYPDLDIAVVEATDNSTNYVAQQARWIRLCVVGRRCGSAAAEDAEVHAALRDTTSSLLICKRHSPL